jgi:hypothetical protein
MNSLSVASPNENGNSEQSPAISVGAFTQGANFAQHAFGKARQLVKVAQVKSHHALNCATGGARKPTANQ